MGMYTELHFNVELKPKKGPIVDALKKMVLCEEATGLDHPLFQTDRWTWMLGCDSYYFPADTHSTMRWDDIGECWYLCIRCNLKNYSQEIEKFIDWITPHCRNDSTRGFAGYYRYEEDEDPTLIYLED